MFVAHRNSLGAVTQTHRLLLGLPKPPEDGLDGLALSHCGDTGGSFWHRLPGAETARFGTGK